jgi:hypothetical protein
LKHRFETLTSGDRYPGYSCWVLLTDEHLASRINLKDHIPTQLSTPLMSETEVDQGYISTQASLIELALIVDENILLTESCGLRVNVSIAETGRAESLSLREAKRMTTLVLLLEDMHLWPLCPAKRREHFHSIRHSRIVAARHMVQVNREYRLEDDDQARLYLPPILKAVLGEALKTIWACPSIGSLADGLKEANPAGLRTAVRLNHHRHPRTDDDWSMEFCHAPASFRPTFIEDWLNVVLTIAKAASLTSRQFRELIEVLVEARRSIQIPYGGSPDSRDVQHLLDVLGAAMQPYWSVRLPGRSWAAELEMLKQGIDPNASEDGTAVFQ